jgi:hypothetical protein
MNFLNKFQFFIFSQVKRQQLLLNQIVPYFAFFIRYLTPIKSIKNIKYLEVFYVLRYELSKIEIYSRRGDLME